MENQTFLKIKHILRITSNDFDDEIKDLIEDGLDELQAITNCNVEYDADGMLQDRKVFRAVATFCRVNFGEPQDYERLKRSYDEQKAQLKTIYFANPIESVAE